MAVQNIQMNVKTAAGYDQLNPLTSASNVSYTNTVSGLAATNTQAAIDEVVVKTIAASLTVAGWTGNAAPYTQTISIAGAQATSGTIIVALDKAATAQQRARALAGGLVCTGRADGSITVTAKGFKPLADIPIVIALLHGQAEIINAIPVQVPTKRVELCRFTTSGTFNPADYPTLDGLYDIYIVGGGGGGYYALTPNDSPYITGGGGGYAKWLKNLNITSTAAVTIGGAGSKSYYEWVNGSTEYHEGTNGGTSAIGTYGTAAGGTKASGSNGGNGGCGGAGVGGSFGGVDGNSGTSGKISSQYSASNTISGTGGTGGGNIDYAPTNPYDGKQYGIGGNANYTTAIYNNNTILNFPALNNNAGRGGGANDESLPGICIIYGYELEAVA